MGRKYDTRLLGIGLVAILAVSCGESGDDGAGGGGASSGTGASSAGGGTNSGGSSSGGTSSGGSSSASGGASGSSSGGTSAGTGGSSAGTGGSSAGTGGDGVCGGLTPNGRCVDNVYEWCDYFTGGVARLDCTPLGATCRANATQSSEDEMNGCVTRPCTGADQACDGPLFRQCEDGIVTNDCRKFGGPDSTCELVDTRAHCTHPTCTTPNVSSCDGNFRLICDETGELHVEDCARCNPAGTCVLGDPMSADGPAQCTEFSSGCE